MNETGDDESLLETSSIGEAWVSQFCEMANHVYFCAVSEEFMEDEFNLTGLSSLVPRYKQALELILDLEPDSPVALPDIASIQESGELLYGLIHARYIVTRQGLQAMARKYERKDFGVCPRYHCQKTPVLPIGRQDMPGFETVRLFCPCCRDIYVPSNSRFMNIDGAFFGSSFAGMFLMMYPEIEKICKPLRATQFDLKIFGFRVSEYSRAGPRMRWLRMTPESKQAEEDERRGAPENASAGAEARAMEIDV